MRQVPPQQPWRNLAHFFATFALKHSYPGKEDRQRQQKKQIPCGDDNKKGKCKCGSNWTCMASHTM